MNDLAGQFTRYVTEVTGRPVKVSESVTGALPQHLLQLYNLYEVAIDQRRYLGIALKEPEQLRPAQFEKDAQRLLQLSGLLDDYCLIADGLPSYVRQRLIGRRIPFVIPGQQLNWPALGLALQARARRYRTNAGTSRQKLSPASQVAVLYALNAGPTPITPKALAETLGYSSMTWSRALNEIQACELGRVVRKGKERLVDFPMGKQTLWEEARKYLSSPVRESVRLQEHDFAKSGRIRAGETALATYSQLSPPSERVFAIGRDLWKRLAKTTERIPVRDIGTCRVEIWHYDPALFAREEIIDPFSLYLSLQDETDERVLLALDEMMEQILWS